VESKPFGSALELLAAKPAAKWGAILSSLAATSTLLLLVPVLYLAIDLMVNPSYSAADGEVLHGLAATAARNQDHWLARPLAFLARNLGFASVPTTLLAVLASCGFGLVLLRGLFLNASAHWSCQAAIDVIGRMRRNIYNHCFRLATLAIHPDQQADAGRLITDRAEAIQTGLIAWLTSGFRGPYPAAIAALVAVGAHPWLGLAGLCLLACVWLLAGQVAAWYRRDARVAARRAEAKQAVLRESLSLLQLSKCFLIERFSTARVERQIHDLSKATRHRLRGETISRPTLATVVMLAGIVLFYLAGRSILGGGMSVAALVVLGCALSAVVYYIQSWLSHRVVVRQAEAAAAEVFEFLDRRGDSGQAVDAEFLQPLSKRMEFVELSYREPGSGRMILDHVSFTIPAYGKTAIVTSDPAEARTLAYLLTRFIEPTAGEIRIDGRNIRWVTYDSLRTQIVPVLSGNGTFTDTVANNIGCGDPGFSRPQIIEAAKAAHAHQFIQQLPYGYETVLGGSGHALRPGEQFRIALARAILRDPSVLVLEEPFEPFDADSAALIDDAVAHFQGQRTIVILARRKRTVKTADQRITIHHGRVAEGDPDETGNHRPLRPAKAEAGSHPG
jgi:ABC-type multidrug transport system fused ATPase/permease subunit